MNVFILGSGTMATGIAQVLAAAESVTKLTVVGRESEKCERLLATCTRNLQRSFRKLNASQDGFEQVKNKLQFSLDLKGIEKADLVIEAIVEDLPSKLELFRSISSKINSRTIVASNTSSLSITEFSSCFDSPENILGLHFFNPAPHMELVEIIAGHSTSIEVLAKMSDLISSLSKTPVVVQEAPGFIVNRMLIPMINEGISILAESVASAEDIDKAMKLGANHPMGPLALADLIGNDVSLSIMDSLYKETGDSKYRAHPLLRKMVRANHLGRKTKQGFYSY